MQPSRQAAHLIGVEVVGHLAEKGGVERLGRHLEVRPAFDESHAFEQAHPASEVAGDLQDLARIDARQLDRRIGLRVTELGGHFAHTLRQTSGTYGIVFPSPRGRRGRR